MSESENQPGLQLPVPIPEQSSAPVGPSPENLAGKSEQMSATPEAAGSVPAPPPVIPAIPLPAPPTSPQSDVVVTTPTTSSAVADDGDLIEKEWVDKAKRIVEANRNNPYNQSEELTVVKADYMQKRYNKTIKLNK